eukprot:3251164-Pleurochrysis_carterae.AAC.1
MDSGTGEIVGEARRKELTRVVRVQRSDDLGAVVLSVIEGGSEECNELAHIDRSFRLCAHGVSRFVA